MIQLTGVLFDAVACRSCSSIYFKVIRLEIARGALESTGGDINTHYILHMHVHDETVFSVSHQIS